MKRFWALFLIFSLLLCGCTTGQTNSASQSNLVAQSSSVVESSSVPQSLPVPDSSSVPQSSSVENNRSKVKTNCFANHSFFVEDSSKSDEYNEVIKCYNNYLIEGLENWYYDENYNYGGDIITGYCLYDFANDGIPELLVRYGSPILQEAEVCTYLNGDIAHSWVGDMCILKNGMIGYNRVSTYDRYTFYKYNENGNFDRILKLEEVHTGPETENDFYIDDVQVSKEEYFNIADKWIEEYEKSYYPSYRSIEEEYKALN